MKKCLVIILSAMLISVIVATTTHNIVANKYKNDNTMLVAKYRQSLRDNYSSNKEKENQRNIYQTYIIQEKGEMIPEWNEIQLGEYNEEEEYYVVYGIGNESEDIYEIAHIYADYTEYIAVAWNEDRLLDIIQKVQK